MSDPAKHAVKFMAGRCTSWTQKRTLRSLPPVLQDPRPAGSRLDLEFE